MRLAYLLPLLLLPGMAMAQATVPPSSPPPAAPDPTVAAQERATESMLINTIRNWQQSATDREVTMDALRNAQQQMAAKAKEATDKDAEIKKLTERVEALEAANSRLVGQAKQRPSTPAPEQK